MVAKSRENRRRTGVGGRARAVRIMKVEPVGEKQDSVGVPPHRHEPVGLGAGMQKGGADTMVGETLHPVADLVATERRIEPDTTEPRCVETMMRSVSVSTVPRARIRGAGIQVEGAERVDDVARRDPVLGSAYGFLVTAEGHVRWIPQIK